MDDLHKTMIIRQERTVVAFAFTAIKVLVISRMTLAF